MDQLVRRAPPSEAVDVGPLRNSVGFLLRMAQLQTFEEYFTELSDFELKPGEFSVLTAILHSPGIRQGALAQRLMIKRAHMTKLVRSLEERGYVARTIPDGDRRSVLLKLTSEGRTLTRRHWTRFHAYERTRRSRLPVAEERELVRLLQAFVGFDKEVTA